ncbi:MAG: GNAT family N-acetyltransferase, partial [Leptolyngbya sp.]|nr:GNAT family N-acetyltransferase [Leptolyngbya sp.]
PRLWLGRLGGLEATDAEAAIAFLHQACEILRQRGCSQVLGPMDGSTWQSYRCALNWENGPPFWGEPQTDPCWVNWLTQAGFTPVAKYESRLCLDLRQTHRPRRRRHSLPSVRIQSAQGLTAEALLPHIHTLVMASFRRQPFFQPWPETVFTQHLRPLLSQMDPELIHLAWDQDRLVGLVLALPDGLATDGRRLIIKTLAIWPGRAYAGLGATLLESAHHAGFRQGYRQAIHALMHSQNPSLSLSRRYSQPFRDYVLMGKNLT